MAFLLNGTSLIDDSRNANNLGFVQQDSTLPFWLNKGNVQVSYTVPNGYNAMSVGPITIDTGITVTIGSGETWTIL